jgi:hypothetical protein
MSGLSSPLRTRRTGAEWVAVALVAGVIALAFTAEPLGMWGGDVHQWLPPMSAHVDPELHGWLLLPLVVAVATGAYGQRLAATLPWRRLLALTWVVGLLWGFGLAVGRGWQEGVVAPLADHDEYLVDVPRASAMGVGSVLRDYTDYILLSVDDHWATHNSGHPPLPLLFYTGLDKVGLGGAQASGLVTAAIGSTAVVAVLVTMRVLGDERRARTAAPFLALSPLVIWIWISADGMFAAVVAGGVAVLACAAVSAQPARAIVLSTAAGLVLGIGLFLSYGLLLMAPIAVAVLVAARQWRPLLPAALAALAVVGAFALAGFWWYEAQQILVTRYYEGKGADRQFGYWVWGNLAVAAITLGPAVWAAGGAAARQVRRDPRAALRGRSGALWLGAGAAVAVIVADLSMLSKSEVERIWLPFLIWLVPLTAQLRAADRRSWLALQAAWALGVCVVFRTSW